MEIQRVKVKVMRDQLCTVSRDVGAHEVAVLQAVHGDAAVDVLGDADGVMTINDVAEEYQRLATRYGFDNERKQSYAEIAYGRGNAQLAAALKSAQVKKQPAVQTTRKQPAVQTTGGQEGSATDPT